MDPDYDIECARKVHLKPIQPYVDAHTYRLYECLLCGEQKLKKPNKVQQGRGCYRCGRKRVGEACRIDINIVKETIVARNYIYNSHFYKNGKLWINCSCPVGHVPKDKLWTSFNRGSGCKTCATIECAKKRRLTIDFIRSETEKGGEVLLSDTYVNNETPILKLCVKKHKYTTTWSRHESGKRCPLCADIKTSSILRTDASVVKDTIEYGGEILLSTEYVNNNTPLEILCVNKHVYKTTWTNHKDGHRCPECSGNKRLTIETVRERALKKGFYTNSESYINNTTIMSWSCVLEWHPVLSNYANVGNGNGCAKCSAKNNKWESSIYNSLVQKYEHLRYNPRKILKTKTFQLDIWDPVNRRAIELDGDYWHNRPKQIRSDARKDKECEEAGIRLLRVRYSEYMKNPVSCMDKLVDFLKT